MKKAVALALATALSTASVGGIAFAQTTSAVTAADDMVTVVQIKEDSDSDDATTQIPMEFRNPTAEVTAQAQTEIQSDPALLTALEDKNVQLDNVVAIDTAANGGKIVYVK